MHTHKNNNGLLKILFVAVLGISGCMLDTQPEPIGSPAPAPELDPGGQVHCTAACQTLLGGCFEALDPSVVVACRVDCEAGELGFDVECLAELDCSEDVSDCAAE
jgi:hypothetical protein